MIKHQDLPFLTRIVDLFLRGDVAVLLILLSLVLGVAALFLTPREEEPQIVVPLADIMISAPGLSSYEVERQVTERLEKLVYQIDGVEYVYSMSAPGRAVVTVRFYVGEDREDSIVKLYNKVHANIDRVPPVVESWVVKPVEIDDVPIVLVTLWAKDRRRYNDADLRRIAEQIQYQLQGLPNTNRVETLGGRPRRVRVEIDPTQLASRQTTTGDVINALRAADVTVRAGRFEQQDREMIVEAGPFLEDARQLGKLVVNMVDDRPVYLEDVAQVVDGPDESETYTWIGFGPADTFSPNASGGKDAVKPSTETKPTVDAGADDPLYPAVQIAVAKRKGSNAVWVADSVKERMEELSKTLLPDGVEYRITRDYGETAHDKVNELVEGLTLAVLTVIVLIGLSLGWRAALVIALAVPVCYGLTLFVNLMVGYSINRVTMFALILSLGLLVDDPITDVENIARYFALGRFTPRSAVLMAIQEVRPALILSTLAIIVSFLPLFFITGMMGPYMAPMALNVPLTVGFSTFVAFLITPWLTMVALRGRHYQGTEEATLLAESSEAPVGILYSISQTFLVPILRSRLMSLGVLGLIVLMFLAALLVPMFRVIPLKMLPYDNKNEFQVVIDMPEGTTLERTDAATRELGRYLGGVAEVRDYELFVGVASPMDFNGLVRHYYLREGSNVAEIRVNLESKDYREQQSHEIVLRLRNDLQKIADAFGADIKVVEVPPGPPVLATITAEVYAADDRNYEQQIAAARVVENRLAREPGIVDVDSTAQHDQIRWVFQTDKVKAGVLGISTDRIADTLAASLGGARVSVLHQPAEVEPLWIRLRVPRERRSALEDLKDIYVRGDEGQMVQLGQLGKFVEEKEYPTIYHKNLRRVVFVYGEVAGRPPAKAIIDILFDQKPDGSTEVATPDAAPRPLAGRTWFQPGGGLTWSIPPGFQAVWNGEGEWKITLDVFRDLGIAFLAAQIGIFVILMFQTGSRVLPLIIMSAIPLTMIGIMPGFWLLNELTHPVDGWPNPVFMTATAMIGMIALSGIVVRNSVVLIDFIHHGEAHGLSTTEAIARSVAVRMRPILLTAGTTLLGNWVITLDPIFSGLAWAIIFGILASTVFTLLVVPVVYQLLYGRR